MRSTWVIARTNLLRAIREPILLFTTLALPFVIITVVGIALGGGAGRLTVGVRDAAPDPMSRALVAQLAASPALHLVAEPDENAMRAQVRRGELTVGLVIPAGYAATLAAGKQPDLVLYATPDQPGAATARAVVSAAVGRQTAPIMAGAYASTVTGLPAGTEIATARGLASQMAIPAIDVRSVAPAAAMKLGVDYTGPSNLTLFIILTSMTSAAALIETRVAGVTRRMYALPIRRRTVLAGEFLGRLLVALAQAAVIIGFCSVVFGVRWGDPVAVGVLTGVLCLFGASLGILVGFAARTPAQAIAIGPPVGVALGMLGGCMWPLDITGDLVRRLGHITPDAWAMDGYIRLINSGAGLRGVLVPVAVIAGMTIAVLGAAGLTIGKAETR